MMPDCLAPTDISHPRGPSREVLTSTTLRQRRNIAMWWTAQEVGHRLGFPAMGGPIVGKFTKLKSMGLAESLLNAVGAVAWDYARQQQAARGVITALPEVVMWALTNTCEFYATAVARSVGWLTEQQSIHGVNGWVAVGPSGRESSRWLSDLESPLLGHDSAARARCTPLPG